MEGPFPGPVDRDRIVSRIRDHPLGDEPSAQRANFARLVLGAQPDGTPAAAGDISFDGSGGALVYFHGGGYVFGSPLTHARIGLTLARLTGLRVVLPAYPLAPEHRWPAQLDVAIATVLNVMRDAAAPVLLAGDSAGGHLALVTALELARRDMPIAGLVLFSPNTDRSGLSTTRERNGPLDPMVDDAGDRELARQCFGDILADDPQVSPVLDDLTRLPPLYMEAGREEVLLGDSLVLARRARAIGGQVMLHVQPDGLHMGQLWTPWWPVATASLERAGAFAVAAIRNANAVRLQGPVQPVEG